MKSVLTLPADNCTVATIHLDTLTEGSVIEDVHQQLCHAAEEYNHRLIVDFSHVERCSSAVLAKLIALRKRIMNAKGRLALCGCGENMLEALKVTGLRRLFDVFEGEAEAMEFMRSDFVAWKPEAER